MVEQEAVNFEVVGSNPTPGAIRLALLAHGLRPAGAKRGECPERNEVKSKGLVCSMYCLYILRNIHNRLYIGQTADLEKRLNDHKNSHEAKFIKDYGSFELVYSEEFDNRVEVMRREKQLKGWTRAKKEELIVGDLELLKKC